MPTSRKNRVIKKKKEDNLPKINDLPDEVVTGQYISARSKIKELNAIKEQAGKVLKQRVLDKGTEYPSKGSKPNKTMKVKIGAQEHQVSAVYSSSSSFSDKAIEILRKELPRRICNKVIYTESFEDIDEEALYNLIESGKIDDSILEKIIIETGGRYSIDVK